MLITAFVAILYGPKKVEEDTKSAGKPINNYAHSLIRKYINWFDFLLVDHNAEQKSAWKEMLSMMDLSLLKNPYFMLFAVGDMISSIGFNIPYIYLPVRSLFLCYMLY